MAKEAEDFAIRLSHQASTVEHKYRWLRERDNDQAHVQTGREGSK
jgi:hypothetical protein